MIKGANGNVVHDLSAYNFLNGDAPGRVNPSLWRQARTDRIYQVRGFDVSNITFIVTAHGYIAIDPLVSTETAAYDLLMEHVGQPDCPRRLFAQPHRLVRRRRRHHQRRRPATAGKKYIDAMGGVDAVIAKAQEAAKVGEYRWAAMRMRIPDRKRGASSEGRTPADDATVRSVFIVSPDNKIKAMLTYPMSSGRNFDEVLRLSDSIQLTAKHNIATPVNWKPGEDVTITPPITDDRRSENSPAAGKR